MDFIKVNRSERPVSQVALSKDSVPLSKPKEEIYMVKIDKNKLAERLNQLNQGGGGGQKAGGGMSFISIKDGRNQVRILPGKKDDEGNFYREVLVHYSVGKTSNNRGTMVVCPKTHDPNAKCPVCELSAQYKKMSKKKDDSYDKQARAIYQKKRFYLNAIDRADDLDDFELRDKEGSDTPVWYNVKTDEEESPVKVLGAGAEIFKGILGLIVDPEYGDVILDVEEGLDLIITKTGSGQFNTSYDVKAARKETDLGFDDWQEHLNDLDSLTKAKTYEELVALLSGETPKDEDDTEDEEEDEEEEKPKSKSKSKSKSSKKAKDEEEEDEDTEEDEDEDADSIQEDIQAVLKRRRENR
ncbi:hypothetical protein D1872_51790 [compost metagenome]